MNRINSRHLLGPYELRVYHTGYMKKWVKVYKWKEPMVIYVQKHVGSA